MLTVVFNLNCTLLIFLSYNGLLGDIWNWSGQERELSCEIMAVGIDIDTEP